MTGVKERREVVEVRVECGEAVARADGVRLEHAGVVALARCHVVEGRGIFRYPDLLSEGGIAGILNGNDVVDAVIAAPQEDEEQLLPAEADVSFGESLLE